MCGVMFWCGVIYDTVLQYDVVLFRIMRVWCGAVCAFEVWSGSLAMVVMWSSVVSCWGLYCVSHGVV